MTHRVNLDRRLEQVNLDSNMPVKCVYTNQQIADILTKGSFTRDKWNELMILLGIFS